MKRPDLRAIVANRSWIPRFGRRKWQSRGVGSISVGQGPMNSSLSIADQDGSATDSQSDETTDDQRLASYASNLADEVEKALPDWVAASVARRLGGTLPEDVRARTERLGREAAEDVGGRVRELLELDIDEQWTNPLTLIRTAIRFPTEILQDLGTPPAVRDEQASRFHPDDIYDLIPASFADLGQNVHDLGVSWGAAKAHVHLRRRRQEEVE